LADMFGMSSNTLLAKTGKGLSNLIPAGSGSLPLSYKTKKFFNSLDSNPFKTFFNFKDIIPNELRQSILSKHALELLSPYDPFKAYEQHLTGASQFELPDALSYLDKKVFLPNSIFHGSDNAFMAQSVELRVPFMDNDLVNFSCSIPRSVKFEMLSPKHLLKSALREHSAFDPNFNLKNHKKRGFEVPGNAWIQNPKFEALVRTVLSKQSIKSVGFFDWANVDKLILEHQAKTRNHERALQVIMSLQLFLSTKTCNL
jgi:asparagine synthase (glutamine-hydrolysing)